MSEPEEAVALNTAAALRELIPIFDIPLQIAVEVGRIRLRVRDLIQLVPGSIIELKKPASEPFDVCINGITVGRGEIIVVDQSSGIRLIEIDKSGGVGL